MNGNYQCVSLGDMIKNMKDQIQANLKNFNYKDAIFFAEKSISLAQMRLNEVNAISGEDIREMITME